MRIPGRHYRNDSRAIWPTGSRSAPLRVHLAVPVPIIRPAVPTLVLPALDLSPRQHEILVLVAEGHTTRGIARRLKVSAKTIETHRAHLMDRLDIHDVPGLVRYAIRSGYVIP